jgi:chromosome segregation ATPase
MRHTINDTLYQHLLFAAFETDTTSENVDIKTLSYIKDLEDQVKSLQHQVARNKLEHSVSQADRSFLEDLLNEKDRTIGEWTSVIEDIEERQAALEAENAVLRERLAMATDEVESESGQ